MDTLMLIGGIAVIVVAGLAALAALVAWLMPGLRQPPAPAADPASGQLADLARLQTEAAGRMQAMSENLSARQAELARLVNERLDAVTTRLGQSMQSSTQQTTENLTKLNERLAVIDTAQKNITDLASQVTSLQHILANKQTRGAFGQTQLESLIADVLPKGAYAFQHTLPNKTRPDCAIFFPEGGPLIIDAKFPLEAMTSLRTATTDEDRKSAMQRVRQDIVKHVGDIAGKYLIPGETQDIAMMFIPSESVYAELHERFEDVVQRAQRARVMIVSPTLMVMAIQVIRQVRKDAQMRDAADKIHAEVGHLIDDLGRLQARTEKLRNHFNQANEDLKQLEVSANKIETRGKRISEVEFEDDENLTAQVIPAPIALKLGTRE